MIELGVFIIGLLQYDLSSYYEEITLLILFVGFFGLAVCAVIIIKLNDAKPRLKK